MADELTYVISATHIKNGKTTVIPAVQSTRSTGNAMSQNVQLITEAAAVNLNVGSVTVPAVMYARNLNATNYVKILNDAVIIAIVKAEGQTVVDLSGVVAAADLKAQADTADCLMEYTIFNEA